jgi:hypothetical protein
MRLLLMIVVMLTACLGAVARAQTEPSSSSGPPTTAAAARDEQVVAATSRAVKQLLDDVAQTPIDSKITVGEFLQRTRGEDELLQTLQRAEQIGGPRWVDDQTCQVQLEIAGARVARALSQIAASKPQRTPVPPDVLEARLSDWRSRTFSSTGSSTAAERVERLAPAHDNGDEWANVSDEARRRAIGDAKFDAVINVFDSIADIHLSPDKTIGDALEIEAVADRVHEWFAQRPVTNMEFRDNLEIQITLSAPPDEIADVLRAALEKQKEIPVPADDSSAWEQVRQQIIASAVPAVGEGSVPPDEAAPVATQQSTHPRLSASDPPEWVDQRLTAEGSARREGPKLRSARAAEANATEKIVAQVRELRLSDGQTTLGAAAQQDPRIAEAIERSLPYAHVSKTDYDRADGAVGVTVEFELRELWEELLAGQ